MIFRKSGNYNRNHVRCDMISNEPKQPKPAKTEKLHEKKKNQGWVSCFVFRVSSTFAVTPSKGCRRVIEKGKHASASMQYL